jgi:hypothetical protein
LGLVDEPPETLAVSTAPVTLRRTARFGHNRPEKRQDRQLFAQLMPPRNPSVAGLLSFRYVRYVTVFNRQRREGVRQPCRRRITAMFHLGPQFRSGDKSIGSTLPPGVYPDRPVVQSSRPPWYRFATSASPTHCPPLPVRRRKNGPSPQSGRRGWESQPPMALIGRSG